MGFNSWNDSLLIGVPEMDKDHKRLFELYADFRAAMQSGEGREKAKQTLKGLAEYAANHFKREEEYLKKVNHPDYEMQKKAHADLVEQITKLQADSEKGNLMIATKILPFISEWLTNHIMQVDMRYKP